MTGGSCDNCSTRNAYSQRFCVRCESRLPWAEAIEEAGRKYAEQVGGEQEAALKKSVALLKEAQQLTHSGNWELDLDNDSCIWSDEIYRIFGVSRETYSPHFQKTLQHVVPEDRGWVGDVFQRSFRDRGDFQIFIRIERPTGEVRDVECIGRTDIDASSGRRRAFGTMQDVTEQKQTQDALLDSERKFRALIENGADIISIHDADGVMKYQSPSLKRWLGYEAEEVLGRPVEEFIHADYQDILGTNYQAILARPETPVTFETAFRHKEGGWEYFECTGTNLLDDPSIGGIVFNARNITERKQVEEQLRHNALYDPLTSLSNRARLLDHLEHHLSVKSRYPEHSYAVLFLDLDRFKVVNDSLGHHIGDMLLWQVARRLEDCVRTTDIVSRLGGDEFVILMTEMHDTSEAISVAERVLQALGQPFEVEIHEVFTSASIGVVLDQSVDITPRYETALAVLRDADAAMYRAKFSGKSRYEIFNEEIHTETLAQHQLETMLRRAINATQHGAPEFFLAYQPIVSISTQRVIGFESLVRWQHPERGMIPPNDFISIAEETGLIVPLGQWILMEACQQMKRWMLDCQQEGLDCAGFTLSINISGRQLSSDHFAVQLADILRETGVAPNSLRIEITESALVENGEKALLALHECRKLGLKISLDDFGTGYSSLSYLHRFPIHILKIDRSFISRIGQDAEGRAIIGAIINLAGSLSMDVVAEGVETREQQEQLAALNCQYGQGYFWSKPVSKDEAWMLLLDNVRQ